MASSGQYNTLTAFGGMEFVVYKRYESASTVESGSFGYVIMAIDKATNEKVAIKMIPDAFDDPSSSKAALRETMILSKLEHENVISLKDIIRPPDRNKFNDVYIVSEYMETDLDKALKAYKFSDEMIQDMKPSNLLINTNDDIKKWRLKIADFGLSRTLPDTGPMIVDVVTFHYKAPELLVSILDSHTGYTAAIDIWYVGCILGEMLTGKPLFRRTDRAIAQLNVISELIGSPDDSSLSFIPNDMVRIYVKGLSQHPRQQFSDKFPNNSEDARDLLEKMLIFYPSRRITVDGALNHDYLKHLHDKEKELVRNEPLPCGFMETNVVEDIKELIWKESLRFNPDA